MKGQGSGGVRKTPREMALNSPQSRAITGQERGGRALPLERLAPAAGDGGRAARARAVARQPVILNVVAVAGDQALAAGMAVGVLEVPDPAGQVACVDVAKARL